MQGLLLYIQSQLDTDSFLCIPAHSALQSAAPGQKRVGRSQQGLQLADGHEINKKRFNCHNNHKNNCWLVVALKENVIKAFQEMA